MEGTDADEDTNYSPLPTYDANPWSTKPSVTDFVCAWSPDNIDFSPSRPTNYSNARIKASLDINTYNSLPTYCPKVSSYYLGVKLIVEYNV